MVIALPPLWHGICASVRRSACALRRQCGYHRGGDDRWSTQIYPYSVGTWFSPIAASPEIEKPSKIDQKYHEVCRNIN
jgi:hypothetical protein